GETVSWSFARELLVTGLDEPAGIGDVRVWPWTTPRGDFVALALSSPDGNALFEVPRSVLVRFLRRTYVVVPRGQETDHLDVDAAVVRLLARRCYRSRRRTQRLPPLAPRAAPSRARTSDVHTRLAFSWVARVVATRKLLCGDGPGLTNLALG